MILLIISGTICFSDLKNKTLNVYQDVCFVLMADDYHGICDAFDLAVIINKSDNVSSALLHGYL